MPYHVYCYMINKITNLYIRVHNLSYTNKSVMTFFLFIRYLSVCLCLIIVLKHEQKQIYDIVLNKTCKRTNNTLLLYPLYLFIDLVKL